MSKFYTLFRCSALAWFLAATVILTTFAATAAEGPVCARLMEGKVDAKVIKEYTEDGGYERYNRFLRDGLVAKAWKTERNAQAKVSQLEASLEAIPSTKANVYRFIDSGGVTVRMPKRFPWYKGMVFDFKATDGILAEFAKGTFADKAFMSATTNDIPSGKFNFSNFILKIKGKTGKDIAPYTNYPQEKEILFLPGTKFKVKSIHGEFVGIFGDNESQIPDVDQWQAFVKRYRKYFKGDFTDQKIEENYRHEQKVPNLVIELEE